MVIVSFTILTNGDLATDDVSVDDSAEMTSGESNSTSTTMATLALVDGDTTSMDVGSGSSTENWMPVDVEIPLEVVDEQGKAVTDHTYFAHGFFLG